MEKKGNRNAPNSSRGSSGSDLKKITDVATGKQGHRGAPRGREPPCGFSKANEASRKPQLHRNSKASDKRPKPRGLYNAGVLWRNEETGIEEFEQLKWDSVSSAGSNKQSLNHLLNFSFAPRENCDRSFQPDKIEGNKQGKKWLVTRKHKYNKEHFLQANCQFIVNEKGDYRQYRNNPDALVDWNLIEQVNVQVNEEPSCPICLYPPVAAKMTKCGHVYCWPCILHYLALSDKQWRKCPICYEAIEKDDLKSVTAIPHKTFHLNDTITFKLMKRQRGSLTAYLADGPTRTENNIFNVSDKNQDNRFSKLVLASAANILNIIDRENTELDILMAEDENCPERCFMEEAKQLLQDRQNGVLDKFLESKKCNETSSEGTFDLNTDVNTDINMSDNIDNLGSELSFPEAEGGPHVSKFFYFYQAEDGQHIYLHAINAKMLEHSYGSLEFGPKTLSGRILEKEGGSMTEELRKKLRYLQHLPVTCQFEVAEIRLGEPNVNKETLDHFKEQIEIRRKRRQRRAKEEKIREKRIEVEENRIIGKHNSPNLQLESRDQFPDVKEAHDMFPEYLDHRQRTDSESTFLTTSERSISPDLSSSISSISLENNTYSGPSFATILATEKKAWPILRKTKPTNQSSSTPVELINATGANLSNINRNMRGDSDPEQEDFEPVPDFNKSFGDALAEALAKGLEDNGDVENNGPTVFGKKKKKKNKQKLLFSTHMAFPGN